MSNLPDGHTEESRKRRIAGDQPSLAAQTGCTRRSPRLVARPPSPGPVFDGMRRSRRRCPESRRAGSWRRSDLPEVLPHRFLGLRETCRTVGVRKRELGRIHTIGRAIRPLRDPALTIRGRSGLVSNTLTDTTDGEQGRGAVRFPHQSGRRLTSGLSTQCFKSHTPPLSCCMYPPDKPVPRIEQGLRGHQAATA